MASLSSPAQLNYPDTFLREVAPQVKSAELIAEDNARQNCVDNISTCFQQACREMPVLAARMAAMHQHNVNWWDQNN